MVAKTQTTPDATVTALERKVQELHPEALPQPLATVRTIERIAAFAAIPLFLVVVGYSLTKLPIEGVRNAAALLLLL